MTNEERLDVLETENKALREMLLSHLAKINAKLFPPDENPPAFDLATLYNRTPRTPPPPAPELDDRTRAMASIYQHRTSPKPGKGETS